MRRTSASYPPSRRGAAPYKQMSRYLKIGRSGEVRHLYQLSNLSDLPVSAESEVALHLLDRRCHPSSKEGNRLFSPYLRSAPYLLENVSYNSVCLFFSSTGFPATNRCLTFVIFSKGSPSVSMMLAIFPS